MKGVHSVLVLPSGCLLKWESGVDNGSLFISIHMRVSLPVSYTSFAVVVSFYLLFFLTFS